MVIYIKQRNDEEGIGRGMPSLNHSKLLGHFRWERTSYANDVGFGQIIIILKSHDKIIAALCVCCGETKNKFYSLRSKKGALYEIESIIKFLVNS